MALQVLQGDRYAQDRQRRKAAQDLPGLAASVLGLGEAAGSLMVSVYSVVGVASTLLSGRVSERLSAARLLCACMGAAAVLLAAMAAAPLLPIVVACVVLLAVAMNLSYPSTVTLGQGFLPNHLGTASGLSYGVATCVGGIASPGLGAVGDAFGLVPVFLVMVACAVASLAFALAVAHYDGRG